MSRFAAAMLALLVLGASSNAQLLDQQTIDTDQVSEILELIVTSGLLKEGASPPAATYLLPNNAAIDKLLGSFGVNFDTAINALKANLLPATISEKLNSIILYHIVPSGVLTVEELGAEGTVPTALPGASLEFSSDGMTITTPEGTSSVVTSGMEDGASFVVISAALMPASFNDVPSTSTADALAILASLGSPAPAPESE